MAAWLRNLIVDAYKHARLAPPIGASRTHKICKVSTSMGYMANVSMATQMRAAYWRSESTFTGHLRDVRVRRHNDTFGIVGK